MLNLITLQGKRQTMKKSKVLGIILFVLGVALLLGSASFWYNSLTTAGPQDPWQTVRDWIATITGVISCVIGVLTYFKKEKKGD
jgi:multisubunit Na+/H+ antiporter MnhG subunit